MPGVALIQVRLIPLPEDSFEGLVTELCSCVVTPPHPGRGPKPLPLGDVIHAMLMRVYLGVSARDAVVGTQPHYNSVIGYFGKKEIKPELDSLVETSADASWHDERGFSSEHGFFMTPTGNRLVAFATCGIATRTIRDVEISRTDPSSSDGRALSALKRRFGSSVRSRKFTAQVNEILCKVICHNLSVLASLE